MSQNLIKLLLGVFASMLLGYLLRPCYNMIAPAPVAPIATEQPTLQPDVVQEPEADILNDADEKVPVVVHTGDTREEFVAEELDDEDALGYDDEEEDDDTASDDGGDWTVARDSDSFVPEKTPPTALKPIKEANVQVDPKEEVVPIACNNARNRA